MNETACPYKGGDTVLHAVWGRRGVVESIREMATRQRGSKWMVRVKWEGGGWGVDGNANFVRAQS